MSDKRFTASDDRIYGAVEAAGNADAFLRAVEEGRLPGSTEKTTYVMDHDTRIILRYLVDAVVNIASYIQAEDRKRRDA